MDHRGLFTRLHRTDLQAFVSRKGGLKVQYMQIQSLVLHKEKNMQNI